MTNSSTSNLSPARLARLVEISRELNSKTNIDDLLTYIISEAAALTKSEAASILLLDPYTRELYFRASSNEMPPEMLDAPVPLDSSIAGAILTNNRPAIVSDVANDSRWMSDMDETINFHTDSILGVPMHDEDRPVGVLEALNKQQGEFTDADVETLSILADLAGVAVEKARLVEELRQAYAELNELDQMKTDFIALASHELRTPLSIILGYVSFLREDSDPMMAAQLDSVLKAAIRLRSLIQDMLNFQYADTADSELKLKQSDFIELIRQIVGERDEMAVAKKQTISVKLPPRQLMVEVDESMIDIIVTNLVNNAIKFTDEGERITIHVEERHDEVWLCVADTGVGVPPDKRERIFRRFYQVENHMRRHYEGMGLGLSIVKELVELHNGRIWIESNLPQGSKFFVALPLV